MQIINQHNILVNKTLIDLNGSMRHNLTFVNNKCDVLLLMHRVKVGEPFFAFVHANHTTRIHESYDLQTSDLLSKRS